MSTTEDFWPQGWSRQRLVHATRDEIGTLSAEESDRMFNGLRAALGPEGYAELVQEMTKNYEERERQAAAASGESTNWLDQLTPEQRVPLLKTLRERCPEGPFGWVVYRTCAYDDNARWQRFRAKWDQFIDSEFQPDIEVPGVREMISRYEIRWIEDEKLANADVNEVAAHYRGLYDTLPLGLQHGMCLSIGEAEVQSVLDSPVPTPNPVHEQKQIPFALGISMSAGADAAQDESDAEEHNWRTSYKVAVSAVTGDLLGIMLRTSRSPRELSVGIRENKIWLSGAGRYGIFTIGVPQRE